MKEKQKLLVLHRALAPYRIDLFNNLNDKFDTTFVFEFNNVEEHNFDKKTLNNRINFKWSILKKGFIFKNLRLSLFNILIKHNPQIILCSEFNIMSLLLIIYKRLFNKKVKIISICDDNLYNISKITGIKKTIRSFLIKNISAVILCNLEAVNKYKELFSTKCKYIYFPIVQDEEFILLKRKKSYSKYLELKDEYQLNDTINILFVGRLYEEKNIELLINSFYDIQKRHTHIKLLICGDGPEKDNLNRLTTKLGINNKVIFFGKNEGLNLYAIYQLGDIFVLPSRKEPFGAVVNEALIFGCRVICSDIAGAKTIIDNSNGSIFKSESKSDLVKKLEYEIDFLKKNKRQQTSLMKYTFKEYVSLLYNDIEAIKQ